MRKIDLKPYRGVRSTLFTGRVQAKQARKELKLDEEDLSDDKVVLVVPSGTTSINPSFYLGLLYDSIVTIGREKFDLKYSVDLSEVKAVFQDIIQNDINDALRYAMNSLEGETGFKSFLK